MPTRDSKFPSTHFAITSVNVPDRLDLREVDDRKQQDEASALSAARRARLIGWVRRLVPYLLLVGLIAFAGQWLAWQRQAFGAQRIAQQLAAALQVPVRVQDTRFRTAPAPAIVVSGLDLGGRIRLDEAVLEFTAPNLWQALVSGRHRWGDVVIAPTVLSLDQAGEMIGWIRALDRALPDSVTRVRFSELRLSGTRLLGGRYEAISRRDADGHFSSVSLRSLEGPGSMQLQLTPGSGADPIAFQCDAADWQPPFPPAMAWSEIFASGHLSDAGIEIEKFSAGSAFGALEGQLSLRRQGSAGAPWLASGHASTVGLDIATLIQQIAKPTAASGDADQAAAMPMSGTAGIEATLSGTGATLDEAVAGLLAAGTARVRGAILNGINLGYAASRPSVTGSASGASTRFTEFDTDFVGGRGILVFRRINGAAGALKTHGELSVASGLVLDGLLHVDLGGARIQAPLRIHVRGTVDQPIFGR